MPGNIIAEPGMPCDFRFILGFEGREAIVAAAGYPLASLVDMALWREVHDWLSAECVRAGRARYTWSGTAFWFVAENDRRRFMDRFGAAVSGDYVQKFAF